MADLRIDETFELPAPPEQVWDLLVTPERIVGCLPGAALEERTDDDRYRGSMTVKLGAVTVAYRGEVVFEETDPETRSIRMTGSGRERTGSGSARMTMTSKVEALENGGSRTVVRADVQLSGKMVRFGRGMIERVAREIFRDFTECLAGMVEAPDEGAPVEAPSEEPGSQGDATPPPGSAATGDPAGDDAYQATEQGAGTPLRLGPLLWRTFVGWLADVIGRVRGRR